MGFGIGTPGGIGAMKGLVVKLGPDFFRKKLSLVSTFGKVSRAMKLTTLITTLLSVPSANAQLSGSLVSNAPNQITLTFTGQLLPSATPNEFPNLIYLVPDPISAPWSGNLASVLWPSTFTGGVTGNPLSGGGVTGSFVGSDPATYVDSSYIDLEFDGALAGGDVLLPNTSATFTFRESDDFDAFVNVGSWDLFWGADGRGRGSVDFGLPEGSIAGIPEPSSSLLLGMCGIAVGFRRQRR